MTVTTNQSKIAEVRDQLSLDFADGKYLSVVSANLGLNRPPYGFSDDTWRALVKVLSLQYKQIKTKFEEILAILLGPKVTQCSSFAKPCFAGEKTAVLKNTAQFPQVGTMVIDEGLATEETIQYCYIDRYTNTVYFDTALAFSHVAVDAEWETGVIGPTDALEVTRTVFDVSGFPDPAAIGSYTVNIGRGTPYEYVDVMTAVAPSPARLVSFSSGAAIAHPGAECTPGSVVNLIPITTQAEAYYLTMQDVSFLAPENGYLQAEVVGSYTVVAGSTTTSVKVAGPLPITSPYSGFTVRFTSGVLLNQVAYISANDSNRFYFYNTLPFAPAAGDKFVLLSNFQYIRASVADNSVLMRSELPQLKTFLASTKFSVIKPTTTVAIAQVQVKSGGWDVIQSDTDHVEILLPKELFANDLRTASYIRETGLSGSSTSSAARTVGDTDAAVSTTSTMPLIGVLEHAAGGPVRYAYYNPHAWITADVSAGATQISVTDTSQFPTAGGTLNIDSGTLVAYTVIDGTTLGVAALPIDVTRGMLVREENIYRFAKPITANIAIGDSLDWYASYDSGDLWDIDDVWPGPYLWDFFLQIHKQEVVGNNTSSIAISGPTKLSVDRVAGNSVFELEDASSFSFAPPYFVRIGENSGNIETLAVQEISLKQRTYTTVNAITPIGSTAITVASLSGPLAPANTFPNAGPYRVAIGTGTSPQFEIVEVLGHDGVNTLNLSRPTTVAHNVGDDVVLMADLIRVSPVAADDHLGVVSDVNKFVFYPVPTQTESADIVRPIYTSLTLTAAGTDFTVTGGQAVFNFGNALLSATTELSAPLLAGSTVIQCLDTSKFPTTAYPYVVSLGTGLGPIYAERVHVTNNNIGLNQLTISHAIRASYPSEIKVSFEAGPEENFSYNSIVGAVISFDPYISVEHTHHLVELLAPTVGDGYPRRNGFDFPLRLPVTLEDRIKFMIDLVRAAGVLVTFISKR